MSEKTEPGVVRLAGLHSRRQRRLQLFILGAGFSILLAVAIASLLAEDITAPEYWKKLGYPGVFFLSFLAAAAMVLPIPGTAAVCGAAGLKLSPLLIGILAGIGEGAGEVTGYAIGFGGRLVVERSWLYHRIRRFMLRRGTLILFLVSAIPNPIFDIVGIAAGSANFPFRRFLVTVLAGKTVKGLLVAYACFYGVRLLPWVG